MKKERENDMKFTLLEKEELGNIFSHQPMSSTFSALHHLEPFWCKR